MEGVTGTLFVKDQPVATFSADNGAANKSQDTVLSLQGHVKVVGIKNGEVLTCNDMSWDHDKSLMKARGNAVITAKQGQIGPMDQIWSDPVKHTYATPEFFTKQ